MKFDFPVIFDQEPTAELLVQYGCNGGKYGRIGLRIAKKSYMRVRLAGEQNWKCCWCGIDTIPENKKSNSATIEHVIVQCEGGTDDWENLASACNKCNNKRGSKPAEEFMNGMLQNKG